MLEIRLLILFRGMLDFMNIHKTIIRKSLRYEIHRLLRLLHLHQGSCPEIIKFYALGSFKRYTREIRMFILRYLCACTSVITEKGLLAYF